VEKVDVKLPLIPAGRYKVRSAMTGKSLGTVTGERFQRGFPIALPAEYKVEVLEVRLP
jgi:hypothetical protein